MFLKDDNRSRWLYDHLLAELLQTHQNFQFSWSMAASPWFCGYFPVNCANLSVHVYLPFFNLYCVRFNLENYASLLCLECSKNYNILIYLSKHAMCLARRNALARLNILLRPHSHLKQINRHFAKGIFNLYKQNWRNTDGLVIITVMAPWLFPNWPICPPGFI